MPERVAVFEPELEQILLEVASNPDSYLLRAPQHSRVTGPLDLEEGVSVRAAGLSITEKHLIREWRVRAAEVLRQAFNRSLDDRESGAFVLSVDLGNDPISRPEQGGIQERVSNLQRLGQPIGQEGRLAAALQAAASDAPVSSSARGLLIKLSHRLRPTDKSRIGLAIHEARSGRWRRALTMYRSIYARSASKEAKAYSLCNSISAFAARGDRRGQLETARRALDVTPNWIGSNHKYLRAVMDLGLEGECTEAAARVSELGPPALELLQNELSWLTSLQEAGSWSPSPQQRRAAKLLVLRFQGTVKDTLIDITDQP